jgi:gamma-glutamyltranspeptidase/glutathione hydrolase
MEVLRGGGNAVDAAVATGLALGVVDQCNSGIGGGGFLLVRRANGEVFAIDGRERAPAAASRGMYLKQGEYDPALSREGPLAVGVPGILAAYEKALERAGSKPMAEVIQPAINLAEKGFVLDGYAVSRTAKAIDALRRDPPSARIYFGPHGSSLEENDLLKQPDLAETYRRIAVQGSDYFYRGAFARRLASYMEQKGGLITVADMHDYRAVVREPIVGTYRHYTVFGTPPPSSGGVHVLQILNMLEASGILEGKTAWDPDTILLASRFMSRAFEDRAVHLGDSDFHPVPVERLTGKGYAKDLVSALTNPGSAVVPGPDVPAPQVRGHTASLVVLDRRGNVVAVNQTVNLNYGAKITLPGTGVILNNEMDDFSAQPGMPNAFGLIGSEANAIEPGKRPLSSMAPTIVVKKGRPVMALGGAGGPAIITAVLQVIVNVLDLGMDLPRAVAHPRFHHQYRPDLLIVEQDAPFVRAIEEAAHRSRILKRDHLGVVNAIAWSGKEKAYAGVSDPRARESTAWYRSGEQGP